MKIPKILIILLLALLLRLIFFTGFSGSDDYLLVKAADDLNKGRLDFHASNHIPMRLALLYPAAFLIKIFGVNDFAISFFPLLCSLGIIFFTYLIGRKLFNEPIGLLAAALLAIFPLEILHSSILVAELIGGFFFLSCFYLLLFDKKSFSFFGGVSLGIAYLAKEIYLLTLPLLLLYLWHRKKKIVSLHFLFILGFLIIFLIEIFYFFSVTGNLFFRQEAVQSFSALFSPDKESIVKEVFLKYLSLTLNPINIQVGVFFYLFYFAIIVVILKKMKNYYLLLIFTILFLLYLNFGSTQLNQYSPLPRVLRYFMIFSPFVSLISAGVLVSIKKRYRFILPLTLSILFLSAIFSLYFASGNMYDSASVQRMNSIKDVLPASGIIYTDQNNIFHLRYLQEFSEQPKIISFANLSSDFSKLHDTYVVVDREMLQRKLSFGETTRENFLNFIEEKGALVKEIQQYQKQGCSFLTKFPLFQYSFFQQKLQIGCKKTDIAVYHIQFSSDG